MMTCVQIGVVSADDSDALLTSRSVWGGKVTSEYFVFGIITLFLLSEEEKRKGEKGTEKRSGTKLYVWVGKENSINKLRKRF